MESISTIVQAAQSGCREAFAEIVARFQDMAVAYAYAILGDHHLAEDAAQAAFLDVYQNIAQLREPVALAGWLRRIVFKQCDRIRRRRVARSGAVDMLDDRPAESADPVETAAQQEALRGVQRALRTLPDDEREVVLLYYAQQQDHGQIAAFLDLPVTTVNNRLAAARRRLKERALAMIEDDFQQNRPSRDEAFARRSAELLKAAQAGDADAVRRLLGEDAELVAAADRYDKTALHYAAEHDRPEIAEILIAAGAKVEALTHWGMTPLEWAANMGRRDVAEKLLAAGARMNMWAAAGLGRLDDVQSWFQPDGSLRDGAGQTGNRQSGPDAWAPVAPPTDPREVISGAFYIACRNGHAHVARFLLGKGANINHLGFFGAPGLHWACINGHRETVQFLLNNAANPCLRDAQFGGDALAWAVEGEHRDLMDLLISRGLKMNIWQMCQAGRLEYVRAMLDAYPAVLNEMGGFGTPLHEAALWARLDVVRLLLERGADAEARNREGHTALEIVNRAMQGLTNRPGLRPEHAAVAELLRRGHPRR